MESRMTLLIAYVIARVLAAFDCLRKGVSS